MFALELYLVFVVELNLVEVINNKKLDISIKYIIKLHDHLIIDKQSKNIKLKEEMIIRWLHNSKKKIELVNIETPSISKYIKINTDVSNDILIIIIILFYK